MAIDFESWVWGGIISACIFTENGWNILSYWGPFFDASWSFQANHVIAKELREFIISFLCSATASSGIELGQVYEYSLYRRKTRFEHKKKVRIQYLQLKRHSRCIQ
jgi:hypothetical protein